MPRHAFFAFAVLLLVSGCGRRLGDGGPATRARLRHPHDVALGADGSLYITDFVSNRVREVDPTGIITTVAGNGQPGYSGDAGPAIQANLNLPHGVAVGPDGSIYIADGPNHRVRRVDPRGIITTVAGNGKSGYSGDGGPATRASLNWPDGVAVGADGSLHIGDTFNHRIRRVDAKGIVTTVAGGGSPPGRLGDGGPATQARLVTPTAVAVGPDGSLYIAGFDNRIRKVDPTGIITTIAGDGKPGYSGDGRPATQASIRLPRGVAVGADSSLYISDTHNHRIRKVNPNGVIATIAGDGWRGKRGVGRYAGDGGPATKASLNWPGGLAVGADGTLYIADTFNHRIRRIDPKGIITTVAGRG